MSTAHVGDEVKISGTGLRNCPTPPSRAAGRIRGEFRALAAVRVGRISQYRSGPPFPHPACAFPQKGNPLNE